MKKVFYGSALPMAIQYDGIPSAITETANDTNSLAENYVVKLA